MADFLDLMREFVEIDAAIKDRDDEIDSLKEKRRHLEEILLQEFSKNGLQNMNIDGRVVFRRKDLRAYKAKGVSTEQVCEALEREGMGELVRPAYSPQSLTAYVRELTERGDELPEGLRELVVKQDVVTLVVNRG